MQFSKGIHGKAACGNLNLKYNLSKIYGFLHISFECFTKFDCLHQNIKVVINLTPLPHNQNTIRESTPLFEQTSLSY